MVGSLFSWKSLFTNLRTSDDWMNDHESVRQAVNLAGSIVENEVRGRGNMRARRYFS